MLIWGVYSIQLSNENNVSVLSVLKIKKMETQAHTCWHMRGTPLDSAPKPDEGKTD